MKKKIVMIISLLLIPAAFGMTAQADGSEETTVDVYVVTDGDLTAYLDGEAGGNIYYYIDGIEVKGEFSNIYDLLSILKSDISENSKIASQAVGMAEAALLHADDNQMGIESNDDELENHTFTLALHYDAINDTYNKLYILRDEVVAFESRYFDFENETNSTLNAQENQIGLLQAKLDDLNGFVALLKNAFIGVLIAACGLYFINRKYPFGDVFKNGKKAISNGKQYKIVDYTKKTKKGLLYKLKHIKRNKEKSPLKFLVSFLHINK